MAEFIKAINMKGFDGFRTPPWQMVPFFGTRYMILRGGAGLSVVNTDPWTVNLAEVTAADLPTGVWGHERTTLLPDDRVFRLFGVTKGKAVILAGSGPTPAVLEVDVKFKKVIRVTFTFVKDNAGHKTFRVPADAAKWIPKLNYILTNQANVKVISRDAREKTVSRNLGSVITTPNDATVAGEEAHITPLGDSGANFNVFLVWKVDVVGNPGPETGFIKGTNILLADDGAKDIAESVAHELGHGMGLDDQYTVKRELMYGYDDTRGIHLPKGHVNTINQE